MAACRRATTLLLVGLASATAASSSNNNIAAETGIHVETLVHLGQFIESTLSSSGPAPFHDRALASSQSDCDSFLTLTLAPLTMECNAFATDLQSLAVTSAECKRVYDFSTAKLDGLCSNKCYTAMVDALGKMAKSGCAPDGVTKTMCDQCPSATKCVAGVCRPACSAKKPCTCGGECIDGGCKPSDQVGVQRADLGTFGYKVSLEHLCLAPPSPGEEAAAAAAVDKGLAAALAPKQPYCFTSMFAALEGLPPDVCEKVAATGCCAGTVMQYGVNCALANDTINMNGMSLQLSKMGAFCPEVDFAAKCPNAPAYPEGSCKVGYVDGPAGVELPFPSLDDFKSGGFDMAGIYAFCGGIAAMCMVLFTVTMVQKRNNRLKQAEATQAAEAMNTQQSSPTNSV